MGEGLRAYGAQPTLFAPCVAVRQLAKVFGVPIPTVVDFESRTRRVDWLAPGGRCWIDSLPSLDDYDEVVSDNLIEVLSLRPQAWLSGSFFWHLALPGFPNDKAVRAEELLALHHPRMISTNLFAAPYLASKTELCRVGMYALGQVIYGVRGTDLLVSCGKGGEAEGATQELLGQIESGVRPGEHSIVWVEPGLYRPDMPSWMQPASFTPLMYSRLLAAVIRPGIGTVTDTLLAGARLFMFYESDNIEMAANARRLGSVELGEACESASQAWRNAVRYLNNAPAQARHRDVVRLLNCNGANEAAALILSRRKKLRLESHVSGFDYR